MSEGLGRPKHIDILESLKSTGVTGGDGDEAPNAAYLTRHHVAFLDIDQLYFDQERYKAERGRHNLNLTRRSIADLKASKHLAAQPREKKPPRISRMVTNCLNKNRVHSCSFV